MRTSKPGRRVLVLLAAVVITALACGVIGGFICLRRSAEPAPGAQQAQPAPGVAVTESADDIPDIDLPLTTANPGYVGPEACGECHAARLAEFRNTRHFRACWPVENGPMPEVFTRHSTNSILANSTLANSPLAISTLAISTPAIKDVRYQVSPTAAGFRETIIRRTAEGEVDTDYSCALIYGSGGQADEVYFAWKGAQLWELPVGWLRSRQSWGVQNWARSMVRADSVRPATTRCVECHNTWFEYVHGSENEYRSDSFILGVSCERCHGPGKDHVEYHKANPSVKQAQAIVHPAQLSREQQLDVCGQCHSNVIYRRTPLFSFQPGDRLEDHFRAMQSPGVEHDHVADQIRYLRQSSCFQSSDSLTCTTCHNPHQPTDPVATGNRSCAQCHQPKDCGEHDRLPAPVRDQCVSCHMPQYNRVAVRFYTDDDQYVFPMRPRNHRIAVYPEARDETLLDWYRSQTDAASGVQAAAIAASLVAFWSQRAEKLAGDQRFIPAIGALREAIRIAPALETQTRLDELVALQSGIDEGVVAATYDYADGRYAEASAALERVLQAQPEHAAAHFRLGTILAVQGEMEQATRHLAAVTEYGPDDPAGENMLGWLAYLRGDAVQAASAFQRADAIYPRDPEITYRWGLSLLQLERWAEAEQRFRTVLEINPNHEGGCQGLSHVLRHQGNSGEALQYAGRAARLSQFQNVDILLSLADAYAADQQYRQTWRVTTQALQTASSRQPDLVPHIRDRLQRLQIEHSGQNEPP